MPPPAVAMIEARLKGLKKVGAQGSASPKQAKNRVKKPKPKPKKRMKFPMFSKLPAEIQQMIWGEAIQKPACHTFKYKWGQFHDMDLCLMPIHQDPSAFRRWRAMLWTEYRKRQWPVKPTDPERLRWDALDEHSIQMLVAKYQQPGVQRSHKPGSKLANISFQAGFRRAMVDLQRVKVITPFDIPAANVAAIDVATDLTIIEFDRGVHAPALTWFEHDKGGVDIHRMRRDMVDFKRVAVHYKKSHKNASGHGPFQCCCPVATQPDCYQYKACPNEQACFLDCFPNMERFYYVVDVSRKKELAWKAQYKEYLCRQNFKLKSPDDPSEAPFEVERFYDMKKKFIQICPPKYLKWLPEELRNHKALPLQVMDVGGARECLIKVMEIYKSIKGHETFVNTLEQRKQVKFGVLLAYDTDE